MTAYEQTLLAHAETRVLDELVIWNRQHSNRSFEVEQVDVDITDDDRCLGIQVWSKDGARLFVAVTFDEAVFDYDAFNRRAWSHDLQTLLINGKL